jgi:hypothetical protein
LAAGPRCVPDTKADWPTEEGCAGDAQEELKTTDLASHQRGHPT